MIDPVQRRAAKAMLASAALSLALCGTAAAAPLQYQNLALLNDWEQYSPATGKAQAAIDANNVVHLRGAIDQVFPANSSHAFTLPVKFRPDRFVYVPVNLSNGGFGRLNINSDGTVSVQSATANSVAQDFTSLEGVTFPKSAGPLQFQPIVLKNNWVEYGNSTSKPAAAIDADNVVHLTGAIKQTGGSTSQAFVLAPKFRPNRAVFVHVNEVLARPGRLVINKDGTVYVMAGGAYSDAQSFTSLEGVTFSKN